MGTVVVDGRVPGAPSVQRDAPVLLTSADADEEQDWYEAFGLGAAFDPAGTLFAFVLALAATVALVVLVAAAVRVVTGA